MHVCGLWQKAGNHVRIHSDTERTIYTNKGPCWEVTKPTTTLPVSQNYVCIITEPQRGGSLTFSS